MIDLHTHILPGLDDGAQSLEEAVAMARVAAEDGVTTIVATPHGADLGADCSREELQTKVEELKAELLQQEVRIDILPGVENYIVPDLAKQAGVGCVFGLNGGVYLLVELPMHQFPLYVEQTLFEIQAKGFFPIIAHPERNLMIQEDPGLLQRLVEKGMMAQVTAASLLGDFGPRTKRAAKALLSQNLVHVIASDAHSVSGHRAPVLSAAVAAASKIVGRERASEMVTSIPQAIIDGQLIKVVLPTQKATRRLFGFWR